MISESTVRHLFADADPIGKQLSTGGVPFEIVGVIATIVDRRLDITPRAYAYVPQALNPFSLSVVVRSSGAADPLRVMGGVRDAVRQLDAGLPIANPRALDQAMAGSLRERRWILMLVAAFAATALTLACLGLYGVMAYAVAMRRRELCIRMALGAERRDIVRQIVRDGFRLMLAGLAVGLIGAVTVSRGLEGLLYQVRGADPVVIGGTIAIMALVASIACWMPVRRATRFQAMAALRND